MSAAPTPHNPQEPYPNRFQVHQAVTKAGGDDLRAKIRAKLNIQKPVEAWDPGLPPEERKAKLEASGKTVECKERDAEARAWKQAPADQKPFPTALVAGATQAMDVAMPEELERIVVTITRMHLQKRPLREIADAVGLDVKTVRSEIAKVQQARMVAFKDNPDLAVKVTEAHFEVVEETAALARRGNRILEMLEEELEADHRAKLDALERDDPYAFKMGINPMKADSYSKLIESTGKQLDRAAEIAGLLGKAVPNAPTVNVDTLNQQIVFGSEKLNALADAILRSSGQSVQTVRPGGASPTSAGPTVDVQAEEVSQ